MHQTLTRRVCTFLQLKPPTLRASADELEHAAAAALLAAFWRARTFCLYALTNAGVGAPTLRAGVAETLMPRDDAEAPTDDAARAAGEAMSSVAVSHDDVFAKLARYCPGMVRQ